MFQRKIAVLSIPTLILLCSSLAQAQDVTCSFRPITQPNPAPSSTIAFAADASAATIEADSLPEIKDSATSSSASEPESTAGASNAAGFISRTPAPVKKKQAETRPFSSIAIGVTANTLGAGVEVATPLSHRFNLRSGVNLLGFGYPFNIDGIDYNAEVHFRSGQMSLDWFPERSGFHVSAGLLYLKNNLAAIASVPVGQYFELGDQGFTNSVDDPLNGTAKIIYPHNIAPMLMVGFSNILPRSGSHFSMPYEFGIAYTGQPHVDVQINGTACTDQGCFDISTNTESEQSLQQENAKLNKSLSNFPVYPIISLGFAYRF